MPIVYKVESPGFWNGMMYSPRHPRRNVLSVDKAFKPKEKPSWLGDELKAETPAQKRARDAAVKELQRKVDDDRKAITDASFMGDGEKSTTVETL